MSWNCLSRPSCTTNCARSGGPTKSAPADRDDGERSWEAFADDLAALHRSTAGDRFGWHHRGYLGRLRQVNTWIADGHEFFAQHRLLRYLAEPPAERALTAADRRAVERLCARLPVLHLREQLSVIAHFGPNATRAIAHARSTLAPFYLRG